MFFFSCVNYFTTDAVCLANGGTIYYASNSSLECARYGFACATDNTAITGLLEPKTFEQCVECNGLYAITLALSLYCSVQPGSD